MDVIGIGNCLMDILYRCDEKTITEFGLTKGVFNLIDEKKAHELRTAMSHSPSTVAFGGSVPNTLAMCAQLGGKAALIGKIGTDEMGSIFTQQTTKLGVHDTLVRTKGSTGIVQAFITADAQRTFGTHLGVANQLVIPDINLDHISKAKILHTTCYELVPPMDKAVVHALAYAKKQGITISIDLADPMLLANMREHLMPIITTYADIIFANEEEAQAFSGKTGNAALAELGKTASLAIMKIGAKGSLILHQGITYTIAGVKANAIDTTGAGDAYSGSFLYAYTHGYDLDTCGRLSSLISAKVVEIVGAHIDELPTQTIKQIMVKQ